MTYATYLDSTCYRVGWDFQGYVTAFTSTTSRWWRSISSWRWHLYSHDCYVQLLSSSYWIASAVTLLIQELVAQPPPNPSCNNQGFSNPAWEMVLAFQFVTIMLRAPDLLDRRTGSVRHPARRGHRVLRARVVGGAGQLHRGAGRDRCGGGRRHGRVRRAGGLPVLDRSAALHQLAPMAQEVWLLRHHAGVRQQAQTHDASSEEKERMLSPFAADHASEMLVRRPEQLNTALKDYASAAWDQTPKYVDTILNT